jgi:myo-inositol-1(or 4)-monophosphatase
MADVAFGYVYDLGPGEEWCATRAGGVLLNGRPLAPAPPERRKRDGRLEIVAIESADPRWLAASSDALVHVTGRLRAIGSIAVSMCQVAATRVDGMATLWKCRAVDAAAAQLVVARAAARSPSPPWTSRSAPPSTSSRARPSWPPAPTARWPSWPRCPNV